MGVPKFYRWLSERYPLINRKIGEKVEFLPEFDNFYLDMNGIIHNCTHPSDEDVSDTRLTMEEMVLNMFAHIDQLVQVVRPQKVLYLAVDGPAPRAKMNQQRSRRFASARDSQKALNEAVKEGRITEQERSEHFDSNCITPGTEFMEEVSKHFQYFLHKKIKEDPIWRDLEVIYSGHDVPGEGEHKIMDYIRSIKSQPGYDPNTRHCCNSLDADLIMLGLATHEPHFALLREEVDFSGGRNSKGGGATKEVKRQVEKEKWELLDLNMLRQYLKLEFEDNSLPFKFDLESLIDDWVVLVMLVGNDFLPHIPSVDVSEGALDEIMSSYREVLGSLGGFICEGGEINAARIAKIFNMLGDRESSVLYERSQKKQKKGKSKNNGVADHKDYKATYYRTKFGLDPESPEDSMVIRHAAESFFEGMVWCFKYYYEGVPSWTWFYPFHYAPMVSDMVNLTEIQVHFHKGSPFKPFTQLLSCLPPPSANFLPKCYRELMTSSSSPVIDLYPEEFEADLNGKRNPWEAVNLLPFIDSDRLEEAVRIHCPESKLTAAEIARNKVGKEYIFKHDPSNQNTIFSTLPGAKELPDILCCETSRSVFTMVPPTKKYQGLLAGACADGRWPGDPQAFSLELSRPKCSLQEISVNVFGRPSRKETFVITVNLPEGMNHIGDDGEADLEVIMASFRKLVRHKGGRRGLRVWVNYPYLVEAEVRCVANSRVQYELVKSRGRYTFVKTEFTPEEQSSFLHSSERAAEVMLYGKGVPGIGGIDVQEVDVMVLVATLSDLSTNIESGARTQHFNGTPTWVPLQAISLENPAPDKRFFAAKPRPVSERFPIDSKVMCLQKTGYGQVGKVVGYGNDSSKAEVVVQFDAKSPQIPPFGHTIASSIVDNYVSTQVAASHIGIKPTTLGKIAGSVYVKPGRVDIGLNLKVGREFKIIGYTRSKTVDKQSNKAAWAKTENTLSICGLEAGDAGDGTEAYQGSMMWEYSARALELILAYRAKFPSVFNAIESDPESYEYEITSIFPQAASSRKKEALEKVTKWLEQLDTHHLPLVPVTSSAISRDAVLAVQRASDDTIRTLEKRKQQDEQKFIKVRLSVNVVFSIDDTINRQWFRSPTSSIPPRLGDRVTNLLNPTAPFGFRGTVVAIHPSSNCVEVLFDREFVGGKSLYGACSNGRGLLIPWYHLLNLSKRAPITAKVVTLRSQEQRSEDADPGTKAGTMRTKRGTRASRGSKVAGEAGLTPTRQQTVATATRGDQAAQSSAQGISAKVAKPETKLESEGNGRDTALTGESELFENTKFEDTDDMAKFWMAIQEDNAKERRRKRRQRREKLNEQPEADNEKDEPKESTSIDVVENLIATAARLKRSEKNLNIAPPTGL